MLVGEYHHSIDPKKRVSIPAKMREELGEEMMIVRSIRGNCLKFFSMPEWNKYIEPINGLDRKVAEEANRFFYCGAAQGGTDSLGRMLLTEVLLKHIGIDVTKEEQRNVVLLGCGTYGEIWAESDYCKQAEDQDDIRRKLEESGL